MQGQGLNSTLIVALLNSASVLKLQMILREVEQVVATVALRFIQTATEGSVQLANEVKGIWFCRWMTPDTWVVF